MKQWVWLGVPLVVLLSAEPALCAKRQGKGVEFDVGARLGYAIPSGRFTDLGSEIGDAVVGEIPLALELGIRPVPMLALGGYFEFAPGINASALRDLCDRNGTDCSVVGFRLGLMVHLHVLPHGQVDPWLGAGVGFEALGLNQTVGSDRAEQSTFSGAEFPLRVGVDFQLSERFYLGPFFGYTFGRFTSLDCEGPICMPEGSRNIPSDIRAAHGWLHFGAKLTVLAY